MAVYENLPVFKASYDLLLASFKLCSNLSRDYRYTLGERLKTELTDLMICIYRANGTEAKLPFLTEARERVVVIKLHVRLLHDMKQISLKQFALQAENIESVSKQLTAWQKKYS
jgi:hypothetical protein